MKENFIKGEWEVSHSYPGLDILHDHPAVWCGGFCVAQMCDLDESEENAHLIATAPAMYREIQNDIANLVSIGYDMDINSLEYAANRKKVDRKLKLLAKARGEA